MKAISKISIVLMSIVLAAGICSAKAQEHGNRGGGRGHHGNKHGYHSKNHAGKAGLSSRVYSITDADSVQRMKMKPYVDKATKRIDALRASYQKQEGRVLDSLRTQLKPILKEDQLKKLDDFNKRKTEKVN